MVKKKRGTSARKTCASTNRHSRTGRIHGNSSTEIKNVQGRGPRAARGSSPEGFAGRMASTVSKFAVKQRTGKKSEIKKRVKDMKNKGKQLKELSKKAKKGRTRLHFQEGENNNIRGGLPFKRAITNKNHKRTTPKEVQQSHREESFSERALQHKIKLNDAHCEQVCRNCPRLGTESHDSHYGEVEKLSKKTYLTEPSRHLRKQRSASKEKKKVNPDETVEKKFKTGKGTR